MSQIRKFHAWLQDHHNDPREFWLVVAIVVGVLVFILMTR